MSSLRTGFRGRSGIDEQTCSDFVSHGSMMGAHMPGSGQLYT